MSWLQKSEPISLYQTSSIPYLILNNNIYLCHSNFYAIEHPKIFDDYTIIFSSPRQLLSQQSASYHKFKKFPVTINKKDILTYMYPNYKEETQESQRIAIIDAKHINKLRSRALGDFFNEVENFDFRIILTNENIESNTRIFEDNSSMIFHENSDWWRTCILIAHETYKSKFRGNNWTTNLGGLEIYCYGLESTDFIKEIEDIFQKMKIDTEISWEF